MIQIENKTQAEEYYNHFPLVDYFGFDIKPFTKIVQFENDELILREGEEPNFLFYLIDGRAKLFLTHDNGRISLVNFLSAPCFIGEMELLDAQKFANGVKAITKCTCFAIQSKLCKEQILQDVKFLRHICVFLGKKAINNTDNYSRNQSYPLDVRLADFVKRGIIKKTPQGYHIENIKMLREIAEKR